MTETITVLVTCLACGWQDGAVTVETRRPGEDIREFMQRVQYAVGAAHAARRMGIFRDRSCAETRMTHIKIPMANRAVIGGPVTH
jgi:hypothetical protein